MRKLLFVIGCLSMAFVVSSCKFRSTRYKMTVYSPIPKINGVGENDQILRPQWFFTLDKDANSPVYDLNGRKLERPQKGINIIGGKKVMVK